MKYEVIEPEYRYRPITRRKVYYCDSRQSWVLPLTKGYEALISEEDLELASHYWHVDIEVKADGSYYIKVMGTIPAKPGGRRKKQAISRAILERMLGRPLTRWELADHKNRDTLDNRRGNIRLATPRESVLNRQTKGMMPGIRQGEDSRWKVRVDIGDFASYEEAYLAAKEASIRYLGEFSPYYDHEGGD